MKHTITPHTPDTVGIMTASGKLLVEAFTRPWFMFWPSDSLVSSSMTSIYLWWCNLKTPETYISANKWYWWIKVSTRKKTILLYWLNILLVGLFSFENRPCRQIWIELCSLLWNINESYCWILKWLFDPRQPSAACCCSNKENEIKF